MALKPCFAFISVINSDKVRSFTRYIRRIVALYFSHVASDFEAESADESIEKVESKMRQEGQSSQDGSTAESGKMPVIKASKPQMPAEC